MDLWIVLVIILVAVLVWRGPKTLPQLGKAFGRGVREAREEASKAQAEIQSRTTVDPDDTDAPRSDVSGAASGTTAAGPGTATAASDTTAAASDTATPGSETTPHPPDGTPPSAA